jgi:hypothetical protein
VPDITKEYPTIPQTPAAHDSTGCETCDLTFYMSAFRGVVGYRLSVLNTAGEKLWKHISPDLRVVLHIQQNTSDV